MLFISEGHMQLEIYATADISLGTSETSQNFLVQPAFLPPKIGCVQNL